MQHNHNNHNNHVQWPTQWAKHYEPALPAGLNQQERFKELTTKTLAAAATLNKEHKQ
jgi:hypothetical protein